MDDGGSPPGSDLSADAAVPLVITAEALGGAGLLIVVLFAYLKASPVRMLRVVAWQCAKNTPPLPVADLFRRRLAWVEG
jgi:hypothetical protein